MAEKTTDFRIAVVLSVACQHFSSHRQLYLVRPFIDFFYGRAAGYVAAGKTEHSKKQTWVPYSAISKSVKRALIAAEDAKFLDHDGFDWDGIETAWEKNLAKGRIVAGGSTISQQLAKNLFLSASKTPWRKLDEALITVMLETILDKQRIYEIYLNVIEWGEGIYGVEAAAKYYFGVSAKRLSAYQAAYLAAMVPNPRYYQTHRRSAHLLHKTSVILKRMRQSDIPD